MNTMPTKVSGRQAIHSMEPRAHWYSRQKSTGHRHFDRYCKRNPLRSAIRGARSSSASAGEAQDRKMSGVSGRFRARTPVA
jgi:hypothetical protein